MSYFVQKSDFIDNTIMWADIINELITNGGFKLISVNGSTLAPSIDLVAGITSAVIEATPLVDTICEEQPWRICVKVTKDETKLYCATPTQISDTGVVSIVYKITYEAIPDSNSVPASLYSGCIGNVWNMSADVNRTTYRAGATYAFFAKGWKADNDHQIKASPGGFGYAIPVANATGTPPTFPSVYKAPTASFDFILGTLDSAAYPFSYCISCTDHGVAFSSWIEGTDGYGCTQNWFVIQRAINSDGTVVTTGKAPLFCLYSVNGGGSTDANTLDTQGIMRFTVRESDVNAPTLPISAVAHTPDGNAVINPVQQVCFSENGRFDFKFPQGFNTARHSYAYQIDMLAYTSADVCSQRIDVQVQVYNEKDAQGNPKLRTYRALSANSPKNTGMRPFILVPTV